MPAAGNGLAVHPVRNSLRNDAKLSSQLRWSAKLSHERFNRSDIIHKQRNITICYSFQDHTLEIDCKPVEGYRSYHVETGGGNGPHVDEVAKRLTLARRAYDLDQRDFGTRAGLSQPQYNQFETGKRLLTLQAAMRLCDEYNLTLDWLYRNEPSGLPADLWLRMRSVSRHSK